MNRIQNEEVNDEVRTDFEKLKKVRTTGIRRRKTGANNRVCRK